MEIRNIKPKDEALVVRHNKLIEARYETTLHQQRIMLWLISEIRPEDRDFQKYRVAIKELAKFVGLDGNKNIYHQIAGATAGMVGRLIEIGSLQEDEYLQVSLISSAKYKLGKGYVDLSIDPSLVPYLLDLKANFTKAYLRDLMAMKSAYSIRMYDLVNQYRKAGKRTLKVLELKQILGIEKKYKLYGDFHRRVVAPAAREINERTDLYVSYKEIKSGRSVDALAFTIQVKEVFREAGDTVTPDAPTDPEIRARLMSHGVKEEEAAKYLALYCETDPSRISANLDKLEEGIKAGKVKRAVPWLRKAINEDYRDQKSLFQRNNEEAAQDAQERTAERKRRAGELAALEVEVQQLDQLYTDYRQAFVRHLVKDVPAEDMAEWATEFTEVLAKPLRPSWVKNPQWDHLHFLTRAEKFLISKTGESCLDKDDWRKENGHPDQDEWDRRREALL